MKGILDTCILIDFLCGLEAAKEELQQYEEPAISIITWVEILDGADNTKEETRLEDFLKNFSIIELTPKIGRLAAQIRREHKIKLPDAILWATAKIHECLLVTRNTKDFKKTEPSIRIPYTL